MRFRFQAPCCLYVICCELLLTSLAAAQGTKATYSEPVVQAAGASGTSPNHHKDTTMTTQSRNPFVTASTSLHPRHLRAFVLACALLGMTMANADCNDPRCRNAPPHKPHTPLTARSVAPHGTGATPIHAVYAHPIVKQKNPQIGPVAPGPLHATTVRSTSQSTHGIIFVGGKNALNPQPIPPGHALSSGQSAAHPVPAPKRPLVGPLPGKGG